jgi:hypothetical protein
MPEPAIGSAIASKVFSDLFSTFAKNILSGAGNQIYSALTNKSATFQAHLETTFERCTKIKTLLNRDEPAELLDLYVNLKFRCGDKVFDDYDVIADIPKRKTIVISGSGGGGKTMFMKYLWIALFENPRGKIPVFVELRRLNEVTTDKLDLYIYHSIVDSQAILSKAEFDAGMRGGQFVLILDGFDEILSEKKTSLEKQILSLAYNNSDLTIIISSRDDDRFLAWQAFSVFHVLPFEKKRVIELVQKLRYDKTLAKKFIERIKKDLYDKHRSFLSNPLLATMMLLTFDQFADIPEKVHLFYEQAFDTLFAKHDATKEAYKRKMYTGLSIDVFKSYLSYFCLATYYDEKFELSESEILSYLAKCLKIENGSAKPVDFLQDLVESVCTLQKDGLNFVFTHRSFQEFFAAYCLAHVTHKHFDDIIMKIARRPTDKVIMMLYDMKKELLEDEFLLPRLRALRQEIENLPADKRFLVHYSLLLKSKLSILVDNHPSQKFLGITHSRESDAAYLIELTENLYPQYFPLGDVRINRYKRRDAKLLRATLPGEMLRVKPRLEINLIPDATSGRFLLEAVEGKQEGKMPTDFEWLSESGYEDYCRIEAGGISTVLKGIELHQEHKEKAFDTLLGIK